MTREIENFLEGKYQELERTNVQISTEYGELYKNIVSEKLRDILRTYHLKLVRLFQDMNSRLPTEEGGAHYWASQSRELLKIIENSYEICAILDNTDDAIKIDNYYDGLFKKCRGFLSKSGGSMLPAKMEKVKIYYTIPIYTTVFTVSVQSDKKFVYPLKMIGEGSYATAFKYKDTFYNRFFVLKRAKYDLDDKELERFKREFEIMSSLSSPYIVEVFSYEEDKNEYIMEYMDYTLDKFISKNNSTLPFEIRRNIVRQILRAFNYLHSKGLLHRDVSPKNILIKKYEDTLVVKISDFGLAKIPESTLTNVGSKFKGYFNDPVLAAEGFENYEMCHEIYALTRIVYYVMTGKTNTNNIENDALKKFVMRGLDSNKENRFSDVNELKYCFENVMEQLNAGK